MDGNLLHSTPASPLPAGPDHQSSRIGGPPTQLLWRRVPPAATASAPADAPESCAAIDNSCDRTSGSRKFLTATAFGTSAIVPMIVFLLALLAAPRVGAEEVFTGQAAAARATDSTWVPAPPQRAALCVVDTGVGGPAQANPDLANVVARFAIDSASPDDLNDDHHGTLMAMIANAPHNGFGMVGAAPSIDIVSVRASRDGATFGAQDLTTAIRQCVNKRAAYNIKVISLSLGGPVSVGLDQVSMAATQDAVDNARRAGLNVVAAAGNRPGAVDWPAGYGPVLAVGAADNDGARCPFAASGLEVDLWASGCPVDVAVPDGRAAWAIGSSEATAFTAAALTQLRELRPSLDADAAEHLLTDHARQADAGSFVDVDASYRAAGLSAELAIGRAAIPHSTTPAPSTDNGPVSEPADIVTSPSPTPTGSQSPVADVPDVGQAPGVTSQPLPTTSVAAPRARLSKPSVRSFAVRRGLLKIAFKAKPKGSAARVEIYTRKKDRAFPTLVRRLLVKGDRLRTRVSGKLSQVSITYRDLSGRRRSSTPLVLHPRS